MIRNFLGLSSNNNKRGMDDRAINQIIKRKRIDNTTPQKMTTLPETSKTSKKDTPRIIIRPETLDKPTLNQKAVNKLITKQKPPIVITLPDTPPQSQNTIIPKKYYNYEINSQNGTVYSKQRNKLCKGTKNSKGYTQVQINGKSELLHRVIYEYHYNIKLGAHDIIDHIDRNKDNNRIGNLRKVNHSQNNQNKQTRADSKTKTKGVYLTKGGRYSVRIKHKGKQINVGTFPTIETAERAYYKKALRFNKEENANFYIPRELQPPHNTKKQGRDKGY